MGNSIATYHGNYLQKSWSGTLDCQLQLEVRVSDTFSWSIFRKRKTYCHDMCSFCSWFFLNPKSPWSICQEISTSQRNPMMNHLSGWCLHLRSFLRSLSMELEWMEISGIWAQGFVCNLPGSEWKFGSRGKQPTLSFLVWELYIGEESGVEDEERTI